MIDLCQCDSSIHNRTRNLLFLTEVRLSSLEVDRFSTSLSTLPSSKQIVTPFLLLLFHRIKRSFVKQPCCLYCALFVDISHTVSSLPPFCLPPALLEPSPSPSPSLFSPSLPLSLLLHPSRSLSPSLPSSFLLPLSPSPNLSFSSSSSSSSSLSLNLGIPLSLLTHVSQAGTSPHSSFSLGSSGVATSDVSSCTGPRD